MPHPDPPNTTPILLSRNDDQCFGLCLPAAEPLFQPTEVSLIYLHPPTQQIAPRSDHRASQLVQPRPSCLVLLQAQHPLQPQGTGSILLRGDPQHGLELQPQSGAGTLKNRTRRHRGLASAIAALQQYLSHRPMFS